jgi:hypothetical protein
MPPTPVRLTRQALEGGPTAPSNVFFVVTQGHAVTSGRRDRPSPSLSTLCDHPRHCGTTPGNLTTSRRCWGRGDKTSPRLPLCHVRAPCQRHPRIVKLRQPDDQPQRRHPRGRSGTSTGRTTTPRLGRIRQDGRQLRGTARHASTRREIVWHVCKLFPPWPVKGGAVPQPRG